MVASAPLPIDEVLPDDAIIEILTHLHPDDLSVCLEINHKFNKLVTDTYVKSRQSKTLSGYLIHNGCNYSFLPDRFAMKCTEVENFKNLEILPRERYTIVEAVSQCRGLICCVRGGYLNKRYYVCKPATGQCRTIPNPKLRFDTAATGIVASLSGQEFKIVRFSLPRGRSLYLRCEVFDSRVWKWHRCNDINQHIHFPGDWRHDGAVFAHGSIHWLTPQGIFAFNMHKETLKQIALPVEFADFKSKHHAKITLRDAKLSLVCVNDDDAEVVLWRMNNYLEEEWGPRQVVSFKMSEIHDDNWLPLFMDLIYSSSSGCNCLSNNQWDGVWKVKLDALNANESFFGGDVFRFESDSTPYTDDEFYRGFEEGSDKIQINTDTRSNKIEEIKHFPFSEICWYFSDSWEQFRINGKIDIIDSSNPDPAKLQQREKAWFASSTKSRMQYLGPRPGLPVISEETVKETCLEPSVGPVAAFCLLVLDPDQVVDYLNLKSNERMAFTSSLTGDGLKIWNFEKINP
ncbi:pyridoxine/pyridoxamine 5'-phosphate oxidase 2 isoform X1 [Carex littledalei]|uniref:Pyridoxine/pyridoxamine 5'-phosphate oxidase 2 isoform X1 n=1 Tax=Carex littledalei TaxID=544730 RepID=A0A833QHL8_9POAL|nr:pyridoxine/pyridoxamine 5'-phosphate oxidase 2 isoform X1 [Carex littledalei]